MDENHWYGYPPATHSIAAWGARAIYERDRLSFVTNRQSRLHSECPEFSYIKTHVERPEFFEKITRLALRYDPSSNDRFVMHMRPDMCRNPYQRLVVCGSPNGSCGHFYFSVSVIWWLDLPSEQLPLGERAPRKEPTWRTQGEKLNVTDRLHFRRSEVDHLGYVQACNDKEVYVHFRYPIGKMDYVILDRTTHQLVSAKRRNRLAWTELIDRDADKFYAME